MKKVLFLLGALFSFNAFAANLEEGKQYVQVGQTAFCTAWSDWIFLFLLPALLRLWNGIPYSKTVAESLPKGTEFKQYHVNFLGRQSENLTRAWALAMALGAESKVKAPLFEAAQQDKLSSMDDIRKIFIDNGVTAEQFDNNINSFAVNGLVNKQVKAAEQFKVHGVPDFYVNGKYRVNPEGLNYDDFVKDYVETVKGLLQNKKKLV